MENKYYAVTCKCGHVGKRKYIPVTFALVANDGKEAAGRARELPRCKHDHKDCIIKVKEVDYLEYLYIRSKNDKDPYLKCSNVQEQRTLDIYDRLEDDEHYELKWEKKNKKGNKENECRPRHKEYECIKHKHRFYDYWDVIDA